MVMHLQKLWQQLNKKLRNSKKEEKKKKKKEIQKIENKQTQKEGPEYPGEGAATTSAAGPS